MVNSKIHVSRPTATQSTSKKTSRPIDKYPTRQREVLISNIVLRAYYPDESLSIVFFRRSTKLMYSTSNQTTMAPYSTLSDCSAFLQHFIQSVSSKCTGKSRIPNIDISHGTRSTISSRKEKQNWQQRGRGESGRRGRWRAKQTGKHRKWRRNRGRKGEV
jgi:hypothetical protein